MGTRIIVFDLDGTLVDTAPDLIASLNALFARDGLKPIALDEGRRIIGGGVKRLIERGLALEGETFAPARVDALYRDYVAHYAAHIADRSRPFPGVAAALDALAARGERLAVCTNKLGWLAVRLLDALGLAARFAAICGPDTFGVQKPDPEILRATVGAAGGALADAGHGRRLRGRHRHRAGGRRAGDRGRFRLQRRADRDPEPRPHHQPVRCLAGRDRRPARRASRRRRSGGIAAHEHNTLKSTGLSGLPRNPVGAGQRQRHLIGGTFRRMLVPIGLGISRSGNGVKSKTFCHA